LFTHVNSEKSDRNELPTNQRQPIGTKNRAAVAPHYRSLSDDHKPLIKPGLKQRPHLLPLKPTATTTRAGHHDLRPTRLIHEDPQFFCRAGDEKDKEKIKGSGKDKGVRAQHLTK
jgi:hypothetical protein